MSVPKTIYRFLSNLHTGCKGVDVRNKVECHQEDKPNTYPFTHQHLHHQQAAPLRQVSTLASKKEKIFRSIVVSMRACHPKPPLGSDSARDPGSIPGGRDDMCCFFLLNAIFLLLITFWMGSGIWFRSGWIMRVEGGWKQDILTLGVT